MLNKRSLIVANLILAFITGLLAYYSVSTFWQPFLINISTTFIGIAAGIVFINIYLESSSRSEVVKVILLGCNEAIADFHNRYIQIMWDKFGKSGYGSILDTYIKSNGEPKTLSEENRNAIYALVKSRKEEFSQLIATLDESLSEVTEIAGWSLNPNLLRHTLLARHGIKLYKKLDFDDTENSKLKTVEYLLDIDIHSQTAREILKRLGGVKSRG